MPSIDTLVDDIYGVLSSERDHDANEENLEFLGKVVVDTMRDFLKVRKKKGALRFSAIGKPARQLWYEEHLDPSLAEKMSPETMMKFLYGHVIEAVLLFLAKEAGHEVSCEQDEVEVDGVKGHMDAVIDGHVVDVKSASPFGFKKFADGELLPKDDAFGYIPQIAGYATCKELPAAFLVADKVGGKLALSPVSSYMVKAHPPGPRIAMLKEALAQPEPPAKCYAPEPDGKSGNMKLAIGCSYCKWKTTCWADANQGNGLRLFAYSTGPRWLTQVTREPDVFEIKK
jgi:hypothetical protein